MHVRYREMKQFASSVYGMPTLNTVLLHNNSTRRQLMYWQAAGAASMSTTRITVMCESVS